MSNLRRSTAEKDQKKMKKTEKMFLGCGAARLVHDLNDGKTVEKTPIPGRELAGIQQNKNEIMCWLSSEAGKEWKCMPRVLKWSKDFKKITVQKAMPVTITRFIASFDEDFKKVYKVLPIPTAYNIANDCLKWFAWVYAPRFLNKLIYAWNIRSPHELMYVVENVTTNDIKQKLGIPREDDAESGLALLKKIVIDSRDRDDDWGALHDLVNFQVSHGFANGFMLEDIWHPNQWGEIDGHLAVIDMGFNLKLSGSSHYKRDTIVPLDQCKTVKPGESDLTFNGESLDSIRSPSGHKVAWKFYTKSEYIMSDAGESRRIKSLGLPDDGLHAWCDKIMFMPLDNMMVAVNAIKRIKMDLKSPRAVIDFKSGTLAVQDISTGVWQNVCIVDQVSREPTLGKHVFELTFDGDGIVKNFHPGHDVTSIVYHG